MIKHVLVPLDGSPLAECALAYARALVNDDAGRLLLLTVVDPPLTPFLISPSPPVMQMESKDYAAHRKQLMQDALTYLNRVSERLDLAGADTMIVDDSDPANAIIEVAEARGIGVIVMATHGRTGISRWLMGSVTSKVLQAAPCPVMVVPARKDDPDDSPQTKE